MHFPTAVLSLPNVVRQIAVTLPARVMVVGKGQVQVEACENQL